MPQRQGPWWLSLPVGADHSSAFRVIAAIGYTAALGMNGTCRDKVSSLGTPTPAIATEARRLIEPVRARSAEVEAAR
jgi:hypothetical protein